LVHPLLHIIRTLVDIASHILDFLAAFAKAYRRL
jgi:hypothetical protein